MYSSPKQWTQKQKKFKVKRSWRIFNSERSFQTQKYLHNDIINNNNNISNNNNNNNSHNISKQQQQRTSLSDKWLKWDKLNPTQLARSTKKNFQKNP